MRKGFTLVELSIVLVIIGLLIGGILVGQSLIESAKVNKIIGEAQQYQIAIRLFKDKFKQLPGDYNKATSLGAPANGDNNRIVECAGGNPECTLAFYELYASGQLKTRLVPPVNYLDPGIVGVNMMQSSTFKEIFWILKSVDAIDNTNMWIRVWNYPLFGKTPSDKVGDHYLTASSFDNHQSVAAYGLQPVFIMAIDKKFDDGKPGDGDFRVGQALGNNNWVSCVTNTGADMSTSIYTAVPVGWTAAATVTYGCSIAFRIQ